MLDIKKIIENKNLYSEGLLNRGYDVANLDEIISLSNSRGTFITEGDKKRSQRNEISKNIGNEKRKPTEKETSFIKNLSEELRNIDKELSKINEKLKNIMLEIPNLPHNEFGYSEIDPPYLVKEETMIGSGNLPKFKDNLYRDEETDLWLIPTAEVSLNALHQGKIISPDKLPLSYVARTPSFRKEHTSAGRDIRGIKRVHQFFKVEMFKFVEPENSMQDLEKMIDHARSLCDRLGLASKLIQLSTGDIGFQSGITFDIEVWAAGSKEWLEVSSISNCFDFQTRRNNTRYKQTQSSPTSFPHTLNGSGLALPRIWVAIIENGQQPDGTIIIPEVLVPYTGFESI